MGSTALGLAYLAAQAPVVRDELLAQVLAHAATKSATARPNLLSTIQAEFKRFATTGFCLSVDELAGTLAVGVPLRLPGGETMSFNCVVASHLTSSKQMQQGTGPRLAKLARDLELLMGYTA
jgi:DNA-binding IclR family transcriptional regulator